MLIVTFTSASGFVQSFHSVDRVSLVGNSVQLGSHCHSVASYAAGLWFFGSGNETFERLTVENRLEIQFEAPREHRFEAFRQADLVEISEATIRLEQRETIARLDDLLQNWYRNDSPQAWPVVVFQSIN
jgi:hypothetical protein